MGALCFLDMDTKGISGGKGLAQIAEDAVYQDVLGIRLMRARFWAE